MEIWEHVLLPLLGAVVGIVASSGFWAWVIKREDRSRERDCATAARDEMILGLGHDRIMYLSEKYLAIGDITADEYENLHSYLYEPYLKMGGNGGAKRNMEKVYKLEVKRVRKEENRFEYYDRSNTEEKGEKNNE
jgi:hypothetical protein